MWPYRDWVIAALNNNMPFDEFTIEQLAGDLLPDATLDQKVATGFHRNTMINAEGGVDPEEYRVAAVIDRVNTTATVWLGTTLGCCQCHSHKYDPFKQKEYYEFMAFFNSTADIGPGEDPKLPVPTAAAVADEAEIAKLEAKLNTSTGELEAGQAVWEAALKLPIRSGGGAILPSIKPASLLPPKIAAILAIQPSKRSDAQKSELAAHYRSIAPELKPTRDALARFAQEARGRSGRDARDARTAQAARATSVRRRQFFESGRDRFRPECPRCSIHCRPTRRGIALGLRDGWSIRPTR